MQKLLNFGIVGILIAALCCFTLILLGLLATLGLSALAGYLNYVLFPIIGIFVLITIYALWRRTVS